MSDTTLEAETTARLRAAGCVFAEDEAALLLSEFSGDALEAAVQRRVDGEPLELVLGFVEFAGLRLAVAPGVFVPRRRTELVARLAIEVVPAGRTARGPLLRRRRDSRGRRRRTARRRGGRRGYLAHRGGCGGT